MVLVGQKKMEAESFDLYISVVRHVILGNFETFVPILRIKTCSWGKA